MGGRAIALACITFIVTSACVDSRFACEDDEACLADGVQGTCEPTGACSFPDDGCPSGRRYGAHGRSDLAGMCVEADGSSSSTATTITTTITDATSMGEAASTLDGTQGLDTSSSEGAASTTSGSSEGPAVCPPGWWDCAWTRRVEIVAMPLTDPIVDAPVLVQLTPLRFDFAAAQDAGEDLRFVVDGVVVPHELEQWNEGEGAIAWVGLPMLGGDAAASLWLYHGNPDASDAQDADAVWSDPFAAVWHFTGGAIDVSGNLNDGVATRGVTESPGLLGDATEIVALEQRIDVPPSASLEDVLIGGGTLSALVRLHGYGGTNRGRIADNSGGGGEGGWMFYTSNDAGGELRVRQGYAGGQVIWGSPGGSIALEEWYHVAATFDATVDEQPRLYIDGVEQEVALTDGPKVGEAMSDAGNIITIGNSDVPDRWFDGLIDELRIERVVRDPAWIAVQSASMRDQLFTYGMVERLEDLQ